jgi:anaerobic magnesium-protoporphyrin IX monomethyl ester cyclase
MTTTSTGSAASVAPRVTPPKIERVLLAYPPTGLFVRDDRCQVPVESTSAQPNKPPLDLALFAAVLEQQGIACRIMDGPAEGLGWNDFEDLVRSFRPQMLIVGVTTPTLRRDVDAFRVAKRIDPTILTVAKGGTFSGSADEAFAMCPELDVALRGEAEPTVVELALRKPVAFTKGIVYRDGAKLVTTVDRPPLEPDELDALPLPARHLLKNELYRTPDTNEPLAMIDTGRGCPHACVFCLVAAVSGKKLRLRSPARIVDEMEACVRVHGIRNFFFRADTFTFDEPWTIAVCQEILARGLRVRWGSNSRVDTISAERLRWMKKAGCYVIGFGVESGSQESLDRMKKRATLDEARTAMRLCREFGIRSYGMFIIGLPWETRLDVEATIAFMRELDPDFVDVNVMYPLKGTAYYDDALAAGLFDPKDLFDGDYAHPVVRTESLSSRELAELREKALRSFYVRPKQILRVLGAIRSPMTVGTLVRRAYGLLRRSAAP